jgi:hypothetical protein
MLKGKRGLSALIMRLGWPKDSLSFRLGYVSFFPGWSSSIIRYY